MQIFIDGISSEETIVAIVVPDEQYVRKHFEVTASQVSFTDLCKDAKLKAIIQSDLIRLAQESKLKSYEIPSNIHLCPEIFSHNNGLITVTMKTRRSSARKHFRSIIRSLYETESLSKA